MIKGPLVTVFVIMSLAILGVVVLYVAAGRSRKDAVDAKVMRIHQLISVGMDIDSAAEKLRADGFTVGEKHRPTDDDYYLVVVPVRTERTFLETFCYTTGIEYDSGVKMYVVIRADSDGVITSVE